MKSTEKGAIMRKEVLIELKKRIDDLEAVAKPNEVKTGMTGSFVMFNYYIESHTAMTEEEFDSCVYDDWIRSEHRRVLTVINGTAVH